MQSAESSPPSRNREALLVCERRAQRLCHARAAVVGRAASNADDKVTAALFQRGQNQFAHAVSGGDARVASFRRHQGQARGGCHLDSGGASIAEDAIESHHRLAKWPGHTLLEYLAASSIHQRLHRAFPAIRYRHDCDLSLWIHDLYSLRDSAASLRCGEAAFERLWSNDDAHRIFSLCCCCCCSCIISVQ